MTTTDLTLEAAIAQLEAAFPNATVSAHIEIASHHRPDGRSIRRENSVFVQPKTGGTFIFQGGSIRSAVEDAIFKMKGVAQ